MVKKITFSDIFQKLAKINRLAEPLGLEYFVVLQSHRSLFCLFSGNHCLFHASDVNLFYRKLCDFYRIGLCTVASDLIDD